MTLPTQPPDWPVPGSFEAVLEAEYQHATSGDLVWLSYTSSWTWTALGHRATGRYRDAISHEDRSSIP